MTTNLRWPDGRQIVIRRLFPNLPEVNGLPDWQWFVDEWDEGHPSGGYFQTKEDTLADAARAIEDELAERSAA